MDNASKNFKELSTTVNWIRATLIASICTLIVTIFTSSFWLLILEYYLLLIMLPIFILISMFSGQWIDIFPSYQHTELLKIALVLVSIIWFIDLIFKITTAIKMNNTDYGNKDLNNSSQTHAVLMFFFPFIMSIVMLVKIKNTEYDENIVNEVSEIKKNTAFNINVIEKQIKLFNTERWLSLLFYISWIGSMLGITYIPDNNSIGDALIIILSLYALFSFIAILIYWFVRCLKDCRVKYNNELDEIKVKYAILTLFFRVIGSSLFLKKLKNCSHPQSTSNDNVNIIKDWIDENGTHWAMDDNNKYYYKSNGDWKPYN